MLACPLLPIHPRHCQSESLHFEQSDKSDYPRQNPDSPLIRSRSRSRSRSRNRNPPTPFQGEFLEGGAFPTASDSHVGLFEITSRGKLRDEFKRLTQEVCAAWNNSRQIGVS